ncbi:MAG: hypothetical protein HN383_16640, partial [Verrucomicrobia bacterium]|nr:hypothetical protein [Verrucomicrobiota bacterium]
MSASEKERIQQEYRAEVESTALRHGRVMAGVAIGVLGLMFIHDALVMHVGRLASTRLVGLLPAVLYLILSMRWLPRHRHYTVPAQVVLLTAVMVAGGLFSFGLFATQADGAAYGAAGTMQATVLAVFVFGSGVRRHLWVIAVVPLALTLFAIMVCCAPSRVEMTLFFTPFITAVCVVVVGYSQDRLAAERFRLGYLLAQHRDDLEEKAEALQLANNELQQFASAVAHDLKLPLHSIREALVKMDGDDVPAEMRSGACAANLTFVKDTADRMMKMIASMLDYACLENCSDKFRPVALEDVLGTVKLNLRQSIAESGATITQAPLPVVWGDRMQLTMLLQELIYNAIKYRKPGTAPTIEISSHDEGAEVRLAVTDRGIGFHPDHRRTVFSPSFSNGHLKTAKSRLFSQFSAHR